MRKWLSPRLEQGTLTDEPVASYWATKHSSAQRMTGTCQSDTEVIPKRFPLATSRTI